MALTPEQIAEMDTVSGLTPSKFKEMDAIINDTTDNKPKEIDFTPSNLIFNGLAGASAALEAPAGAIKNKQSLADAYKTSYNRIQNSLEQDRKQHPLIDKANRFIVDTAVYSQIPYLRAGAGANLATKGAVGLGNAVIQGGIPGLLEGAKEGQALEGAGVGTAAAGGVNAVAPRGLRFISKTTRKALENPTVQKGFSKIEELLTSVPSEFTERALTKELAGNSIFKGKFNTKDLNEAYNEVGNRAIAGMKNAEYLANQQIGDALNSLPADSINAPRLIVDITKDIEKLSHGGRKNPALDEKGDDILEVLDDLGNRNNKTVDFHHIKDELQTKLRNQYGKESGAGVNALKGMGAKIRQALNDVSPEYAQANANREMLHDIKDSLGGMNSKTIASKLRNVEGDANIRSGYNQAAEELEKLVAPKYKFLDEVRDLRAREALESWYPGQYGGFGSSQGAANLARGVVGGALSGVTHNPLMLLAFSPKIGAQGTIKNLGRLYNTDLSKYLSPEVLRVLNPVLTQGAVK